MEPERLVLIIAFSFLTGVIGVLLANIRSLRARLSNEKEYSREHPGYKALITRMLEDVFIRHEDHASDMKKMEAKIAEVHDYAIRNVNRHIAKNARDKEKEEEEALMQKFLEFGEQPEGGQLVEANGQPRKRLRRKRKRK